MKLLGTLTSPFVRKTRIVLAEKKIEYDFVIENGGTDGGSLAPYTPLARIPVLLLDDGSSLFDSRVIVEYLDNLAPNSRLIPPPGRERTLIRRWEALCDGTLDSAVAVVMECRRSEAQRSQDWIDSQSKVIHRSLVVSARELGDHPWCHGTSITLADVALGTMLGYLVFRFPEIDWRNQYENLAKYYDKLLLRPSFAETVPIAS